VKTMFCNILPVNLISRVKAAYTSTGPEPLYELLLEGGFDEAHAKILGKLWAAEAAGYIGKLKERSIYPAHLQVSVRLQLYVIC
jgi:hypothetical protein